MKLYCKLTLLTFVLLVSNIAHGTKKLSDRECRQAAKSAIRAWQPKMKEIFDQVQKQNEAHLDLQRPLINELGNKAISIDKKYSKIMNELLPEKRNIDSMRDFHNTLSKILVGKYVNYNQSWDEMEKAYPKAKENFDKMLEIDKEYISALRENAAKAALMTSTGNLERIELFRQAVNKSKMIPLSEPSENCSSYSEHFQSYLQDSFKNTILNDLIIDFAIKRNQLMLSFKQEMPLYGSHEKERESFDQLMQFISSVEGEKMPTLEFQMLLEKEKNKFNENYDQKKAFNQSLITQQIDEERDNYKKNALDTISSILKSKGVSINHEKFFGPAIGNHLTSTISRMKLGHD